MRGLGLILLWAAAVVTGGGQSPPSVDVGNAWATVSVRALTHKPPKAARKEFDKGMSDWKKRHEAQAGPHFARAVMLDSEYAEAHVMFGVYAARMGQSDQALKSFIRAVELEPNMSDYQANAALVLIAMGRLAEAEPYARRATRAAPSSAFAHFVRGMALVGQEQGTFEAVASLRIAVTQYPQAAGALRWAEEKLQR